TNPDVIFSTASWKFRERIIISLKRITESFHCCSSCDECNVSRPSWDICKAYVTNGTTWDVSLWSLHMSNVTSLRGMGRTLYFFLLSCSICSKCRSDIVKIESAFKLFYSINKYS